MGESALLSNIAATKGTSGEKKKTWIEEAKRASQGMPPSKEPLYNCSHSV